MSNMDIETILDRVELLLKEMSFFKTEASYELIGNWYNIKTELKSKLSRLYDKLLANGIRVANIVAYIDDTVPCIKIIVFIEWSDKYLNDYDYADLIATVIIEVDNILGLSTAIEIDIAFGKPLII